MAGGCGDRWHGEQRDAHRVRGGQGLAVSAPVTEVIDAKCPMVGCSRCAKRRRATGLATGRESPAQPQFSHA